MSSFVVSANPSITLIRFLPISFLVVVFLSLSPQMISAEEVRKEGGHLHDCLVGVRVIRGSEKDEELGKRKLTTGKFLLDVKNQLQPLPFQRYQVLQAHEQRVSLMKEAGFELVGAEGEKSSIRVTPQTIVHKRVRVFVDWKDESGEEILSTTLRMVNGRSMVLGTDSSQNRSTIICVKVNCPIHN